MTAELPPKPLANSYWVEPGRFLAGEFPGTPSRADTMHRLKSLLDAGVDCFIDLTQPSELPSYEGLLPVGQGRGGRPVTYVRKPLRDHSTPDERAMMGEILDYLQRALQDGYCVYLHCRAGIGRTGTVAGCYLIENGRTPEQALDHLQVLWAANARSALWPMTPETEEQIDYVRAWRPLLGLEARSAAVTPALQVRSGARVDTSAVPLRDRYLGALLGLAIGDALGASVQQRAANSFTPVTETTPLNGGGPFELPRGAWTDDTAMALCVAESLLGCKGFDALDQMSRYQRWQREGYCSSTGKCIGITSPVTRALAQSRWNNKPYAGSHDPACLDKEPLGRIAPLALFFAQDPQQAVEYAAEAARTTHQSPGILDACRYFAALLLGALNGEDKQTLTAPAYAPWPEIWRQFLLHPPVNVLLSERVGAQPTRSQGNTAVDAIHTVLWALHNTASFAEGMAAIVNLGGDADVHGALYGQLAGALYGSAAIPAHWREVLLKRNAIETLAERLLNEAVTAP